MECNDMQHCEPESGLTPLQERAAILLAQGVTVTEVADELNVDRSTLWRWRQHPAFQAYSNRIAAGIRGAIRDRVLSLQDKVFEVMIRELDREDARAIRPALFILDRVLKMDDGSTDVREIIRKECDTYLNNILSPYHVDDEVYERRCAELGIDGEAVSYRVATNGRKKVKP
jgi:transcriptional regulator with XRE-family HTH domain